jgi:hypothetical protein
MTIIIEYFALYFDFKYILIFSGVSYIATLIVAFDSGIYKCLSTIKSSFEIEKMIKTVFYLYFNLNV